MGITATPLHITLEQARDAISQIVDEFGEDHRYERPIINGNHGGCWNVWDGKASCLVGRALILIGVPMAWFLDNTTGDSEARCGAGIHYLAELAEGSGAWTADVAAIDYFAIAQSVQDGGRTWGEARDYAERQMPSLV